MIENQSGRITSSKSISVIVGGRRFSIRIHRAADEPRWTLDVIDEDGTVHSWKQKFVSDEDAQGVALHTLETLGALGFVGRGAQDG